MPLFKKRTSLPSTGHAGDDQLLTVLATQHEPLEKPRHWVHYVYVANEPAARGHATSRAVDHHAEIEHRRPG